jgi:hypothetical protein
MAEQLEHGHCSHPPQQAAILTFGARARGAAPGARREKGLLALEVPRVSVLDPDGDIVRRLRATGRANPFMAWPCYHTELDALALG